MPNFVKFLMNLFKHNSTCLFDGLSTRYPHTVDKEFLLMHGRHYLRYILNYMRIAAHIFIEAAAGCAPLC